MEFTSEQLTGKMDHQVNPAHFASYIVRCFFYAVNCIYHNQDTFPPSDFVEVMLYDVWLALCTNVNAVRYMHEVCIKIHDSVTAGTLRKVTLLGVCPKTGQLMDRFEFAVDVNSSNSNFAENFRDLMSSVHYALGNMPFAKPCRRKYGVILELEEYGTVMEKWILVAKFAKNTVYTVRCPKNNTSAHTVTSQVSYENL